MSRAIQKYNSLDWYKSEYHIKITHELLHRMYKIDKRIKLDSIVVCNAIEQVIGTSIVNRNNLYIQRTEFLQAIERYLLGIALKKQEQLPKLIKPNKAS